MGCVVVAIVLFLVGLSLERESKKTVEEMRELNKKIEKHNKLLEEMVGDSNAKEKE